MTREWPRPGDRIASPANSPAGPVFVLCMSRSGSTLLRLILDAHPELACPPETNLPALLEQLAVVWSLVAGAPLSQHRDEPPVVPDSAVTGMRRTVDMIIQSYLDRRAKRQFCDKSLGTARFAELLLRVYPDAKFLCLYRHPMDVIHSALEACPWGLRGYGFDSYAAASPGNSVAGLASYWLDHASMISAVENQHRDRCFRVRYEDLVTAPEAVADAIFAFLGLPSSTDATSRCLIDYAESFGPGDHKIWTTNAISSTSVGNGQSIPAGIIPGPVTAQINLLLRDLGYVQIDDLWGTPGQLSDPRLPATFPPPAASTGGDAAGPLRSNASELAPSLPDRLHAAMTRVDDTFRARWPSCVADRFLIVVQRTQPGGPADEDRWLADLSTGTVSRTEDGVDEADWSIVGADDIWRLVLAGRANLATEARKWRLRYCSPGDSDANDPHTRMAMLAHLLSLARARDDESHPPVPAVAAAR